MNDHLKVLHVLYIALIEIRATENTKKAQVLADIVHNVPTMIMAGNTEEEVAAKVMLNAKRQGLEEYFSKLFATANSK